MLREIHWICWSMWMLMLMRCTVLYLSHIYSLFYCTVFTHFVDFCNFLFFFFFRYCSLTAANCSSCSGFYFVCEFSLCYFAFTILTIFKFLNESVFWSRSARSCALSIYIFVKHFARWTQPVQYSWNIFIYADVCCNLPLMSVVCFFFHFFSLSSRISSSLLHARQKYVLELYGLFKWIFKKKKSNGEHLTACLPIDDNWTSFYKFGSLMAVPSLLNA